MLIRIVIVLLCPCVATGTISVPIDEGNYLEVSPFGLIDYPFEVIGHDGEIFDQALRGHQIYFSYGGLDSSGYPASHITVGFSYISSNQENNLLSKVEEKYSDIITLDDLYYTKTTYYFYGELVFNLIHKDAVSAGTPMEYIDFPIRLTSGTHNQGFTINNRTTDSNEKLVTYGSARLGASLSLGARLILPKILTLEVGQEAFLDILGNHALPAYAELTLFDTGDWFGGVKLYGEYDWLDNWTKFKATASLVFRLGIDIFQESEEEEKIRGG